VKEAFSVRGKRVVVVGGARSGIAAAELLVTKGARVVVSEQRPSIDRASQLIEAGIELELGGHDSRTFDTADLVVVSPGVDPDDPHLGIARRRGVEVIGEIELASRWIQGPMIAVTGTKGKSTTATLIGRMAGSDARTVLLGGNIGVPLSSQVGASTPDTIHVVEVSSFQLETTTTFRPWIALWLNLADDHADRHPTVEAYVAAKARIFANQRAGDWAVVNLDDPTVMAASADISATRVGFSPFGTAGEGFSVDGDWIVRRTVTGAAPLVPVSAVELPGRHMLGNVVAAVAVATVAGISPRAMTLALEGFHGLEHVMEPVARVGDVRFVNDSKATTVDSACRSIESFSGPVVPLIGGRFKGGDLRALRAVVGERCRAVVAIGEAAPLVRDALGDLVPVFDAASMREAVERGHREALPRGVVLLAPACASFDWYRDYAERGRAFREEVAALGARIGKGEEQEGTTA
jgi:UDP-N-acetylmuramoylalanine--D-glutamate ligase